MDFLTMSTEDRLNHFKGLDDDALTAAITAMNERGSTLAALETPSLDEATEFSQIVAARKQAKAVVSEREAEVRAAAEQFAADRAEFASLNDGVESGPESGDGEGDESGDGEGDESGEGESGAGEGDESGDGDGDGDGESDGGESGAGEGDGGGEGSGVTTASARGSRRIPAARKVAAKTSRPKRDSVSPVVMTAAPDVAGFSAGQPLATMTDVAKATMARTRGFAPWNKQVAENLHAQGITQQITPFGVASFNVAYDEAVTAKGGPDGEYSATKEAIKHHKEVLSAAMKGDKDKEALVAAGFCAPSEVSYSYLADYVVGNLLSLPQTNAPRGGLMTTTGPALAEEYAMDGSDFGFTQTEAQAEAGVLKTLETIVCPDFEDHRLEVVGYGWKVPILTEKFYPELVADALRLSTVLFAHKQNKRDIDDITALATANTVQGLGATTTDTLEALSAIAVRERRRWNLGENAIIEVKVPTFAQEVFRMDISRRPFRGNGPVSDQEINAEFAVRNLSIEYLADMADLPRNGTTAVFPATFPVLAYPAGTFVKAVENVINLSAIYDAASLVKNEYTGVFVEQARMVFQAGYDASKFTMPVCTAGLVGAPVLDCHPESENFAGQEQEPVAP